MEITFETLPKAVTQLYDKLSSIERLLLAQSNQQQQETDHWFNLDELCVYLPEKPTKPTVYGWVHSGIIPYHKRGKKLYFLKSSIDFWLKAGRKKTNEETARDADSYLAKKKGGKL